MDEQIERRKRFEELWHKAAMETETAMNAAAYYREVGWKLYESVLSRRESQK
jgi:hypothetical protein